MVDTDAAEREREATSDRSVDPTLRSAKDVIGYRVAATDREIGHISDFLVEEETAKIRYVVVDTRNWLPGRHVIIAPKWIREIKWSESRVFVNVTSEAIENSPEYKPPLSEEYETRLSEHYGYPIEWL
jgi:hypothetical protein